MRYREVVAEPRPSRVKRAFLALHRRVAKIAEANASPSRLFAACVVGAVLGSTPFFGLHFFLCVGAAWLLRLNPVAVYGAANISIPPIAPFLAFACIWVGSRLYGARIALDQLKKVNPWTLAGNVFVAWLIGAVIVGGAIGVVLGAIVARIALARERRRDHAADPFAVAAEETVARFADAKPGHRHYVRWKIRLDPVYRAICGELPDRVELVELGCGLGILPLLVVSLGSHRRAHGIDWDEPKIAAAKKAAKGLPITIERADVRTFDPPACDAIAIVDVLHYFDEGVQKGILERAVKALRAKGTLFVREGESGSKGSAWTRFVERMAVAMKWNRSDARPRFRAIDDIVRDLEALGLRCEVVPVAGRFHPGNVLVRATRAP
jgi:uncharacterized protein (DUF2062 family)/2-polyprenyl-3-methyl-5-hydroxy-6-metoxy-1,4-benzoquinol methylase